MAIIKTNRLILRPIEESDAPRFSQLCNDLDIARNTTRITHPYTLEDAKDFVAFAIAATASGNEHPFAVCRDDVIIACAGMKRHDEDACELGYWVGAEYRGVGVATEAGDAMLQFACTVLKPQTLTSGYFVDNLASGHILTKLGFKPTGETEKVSSLGRNEDVNAIRMEMPAATYNPLGPIKLFDSPR